MACPLLSRGSLSLAVAALSLWGGAARAGDGAALGPPPEPIAPAVEAQASPARASTAPAVRVVGFIDRAPDCDVVEAWYGRCVERVDLLDLSDAWREGASPDAAERATWRNIGELNAWLWEDLAVRWGQDGDVGAEALAGAGVAELPASAALWEATARGQRRTYALPDRAAWLDDAQWRGAAAVAGASQPWFPDLRVARPAGVPAPAPEALLRGRFASRLAYDGRAHPYDLMDGDTASSGPFHEQMYPFRTALASGDPSLQPLGHFVAPEALKRPGLDPSDPAVAALIAEAYQATRFPSDGALAGARALAIDEFHRFYHLVGTQIVRFALEEYTPTHLRVLSALIGMDVPPGLLKDGAIARDVVAASEGQTDDEALIQSMVNLGGAGAANPDGLDYSQLPDRVVSAWLDRFPEIDAPPPALLDALDRDVVSVLQDLMRPGARGPGALDEAGLQAWVEQVALPGRAADILKHTRRLLLRALVERLPEEQRAEARTRLILDHAEQEISSRFDPNPAYRATPQELETSARARWSAVLGRHGYAPQAIPDGPGAVAPTAICTTLDRKAALNEPVFGAIQLDLLIEARDGLDDADEVLWEARASAPFVMVDDPSTARPDVARLVGLPGGQAIYRARWTLWSGWHLLWGVEPSGDASRLVLRTGAVCEDTVLASPDLIPTLARAALLEGEMRANHPITGLSRAEQRQIADRERARRGEVEAPRPSADQRLSGASERARAFSMDRAVDRRPVRVRAATDPVTYLQELMRAPLFAMGEALPEPAFTLAVFSTRLTSGRERVARLRPNTPYARRQAWAGAGTRAVTSAWLLDLGAAAEPPSATLIAPALRPTASVSAGAPEATWRRDRKLEFGLDGGLAAVPLRTTTFGCSEDQEVLDDVNLASTVVPCSPESDRATARTSAALVDLSAPMTLWFFDEPRVAAELGPELQITLLPPGRGVIAPLDAPDYTWAWSVRAGLQVGLRFAPDPRPLVRWGDASPWGVDHPDGSARLGRWQGGVRASGLVGPGFNGLELTGAAELWLAASLRGERTVAASFTPWHPIVLLGPYARGQIARVVSPGDSARYAELDRRAEIVLGARAQVRLSSQPGSLPEPR